MSHPLAFDVHLPFYQFGAVRALDQINLQVLRSSFLAVIGPNGGGKSTLLKLLAGLYQPREGSITSTFHPKDIAYLPQTNSIDRTFPFCVEDVVAMGMWPKIGAFKRLPQQMAVELGEILGEVGLKGFEKRPLYSLSGGQLQRLFFARLIAQDAAVILLDEPFAAVDPTTTYDLIKLLQQWHNLGKTIIVVLHDLALVREFFPTTLLLAKAVLGYGVTKEVLRPENLVKAAFYV